MDRESAILAILDGNKVRNKFWYGTTNYVFCRIGSNGNLSFIYKGVTGGCTPAVSTMKKPNGYYITKTEG